MYALESALDELAVLLDIDPVELRVRNEPETEPDSDRAFSSRHLVDCLREGAERFGWLPRDRRPAVRREGDLLLGTGVASATYPVLISGSDAEAHAAADGDYRVRVNATDIGTGARTVLAQIAAAALGTSEDRVRIEIGSSDLPTAPLAGGSAGSGSWGWAVHKACTALTERLREHHGPLPAEGVTVRADTRQEASAKGPYARHSFGAHFAEVQVDTATGEIRVRRLLGVFAAGRILNSRTARSQFIGGMTMGLGMALMEGSALDPAFGDFAATRPGLLPRAGLRRRPADRGALARRGRPAPQPHGQQGHRGDRHGGQRGGHRQRRMARDRRTPARPAPHPRQAAAHGTCPARRTDRGPARTAHGARRRRHAHERSTTYSGGPRSVASRRHPGHDAT